MWWYGRLQLILLRFATPLPYPNTSLGLSFLALTAGRLTTTSAALPPSTMAAAAAEPAAAEPATAEPGHYESVAAAYEKAFFYSSVEYRDWVLSHLLHHMGLPNQVRCTTDPPLLSTFRRHLALRLHTASAALHC